MELDFDSINEIKTIDIHPTGWHPVTIEYGVAQFGLSTTYQLCWRVQGTEHVFRIPLNEFYERSQEGYEQHFTEVLEHFRLDYLSWYKKGFNTDWMQKYRKQFESYIYTF